MAAKKMPAKKGAPKKSTDTPIDAARRSGGRVFESYGPLRPAKGTNPGAGVFERPKKSSDYIAKPRVKKGK